MLKKIKNNNKVRKLQQLYWTVNENRLVLLENYREHTQAEAHTNTIQETWRNWGKKRQQKLKDIAS